MSEEEITINPEYSAVGAKNVDVPSRAVQAAITVLEEANTSRIAEIGCGLLANTPHILRVFPFVVLVDTELQYKRIQQKLAELSKAHASFKEFIDVETFKERKMQLDGAIVINVIHVLPTVDQRLALLRSGYRNLRTGGLIFIDVPFNETYYRDSVKTAQPYNDGYVMSWGKSFCTFYKNMPFDELKEYTEKVGFQFEKRIYLDHRVTFVCRKK